MALRDLFRRGEPPDAASERRQAEILAALARGAPPADVSRRLSDAASGAQPWIATLTPAELLALRSHGLRPISAVSATCWLHLGWSWSLGHAEGWNTAVARLQAEAAAGGANAIVDLKMKTIDLALGDAMDFTLLGTAVRVEGLAPNPKPVLATVSAIEFVKLLESDIVPTGLAVGANYDWLMNWSPSLIWSNGEYQALGNHMRRVRAGAYAALREACAGQGDGVLAHINFSQMLREEVPGGAAQRGTTGVLARHIVVATTVSAKRAVAVPHEIDMVVDMAAGVSPLKCARHKHAAYELSDREGAI
jgi:hypothetical protein